MIIGLAGLTRCGKNEVAKYLEEKYNFKKLVFSDIITEELKKRGMENTKMNQSIVGDELRKEFGNAVLASRLLKEIEKDKNKNYVIVGFRSPEEVDYIRNEVMDFYLVEIYTEKSVRFARRTKEDPQSITEFFERDQRDMQKKGLDIVLRMADFRIINEGSIDDLKKDVDDFMKKIGVGK